MTTPAKRKILLIGWDGADWQIIKPLLERGEMPNLERVISAGVMGNLSTLRPTLSPLLWNSIATGMLPDKHGILGFTEVDERTGEVRASTSISRKVKAIWNILSQQGLRTHVVNWFCSHPAEPINGICISEAFARSATGEPGRAATFPRGTVHPEELMRELADLQVSPRDIDAQTIHLFVPRFKEVDQHNDRRLERIAQLLANCLTVHAAVTWAMEREPWDFMAVYYNSIDLFCHGFMRYHPPRMEHIDPHDFDLYCDVVNSAYRLHDLLLGRLLQLAGPEATVILCSDHGHQTGERRPRQLPQIPAGPAEEHRPVAILAMKGPGIRQDELVHGASLLDIAPTVLALFGLPVGRDMDGRPLVEAFIQPVPEVAAIPSWQDVPGPAGMHPPGTRVEPSEVRGLVEQFAALGYVEPPQKNSAMAAAMSIAENKYNLARVYMHSHRFAQALPLLEELYEENPLRMDTGLLLAECQFRVGLRESASELLKNIAATCPRKAASDMLLGLAEYIAGRPAAALEHLQRAEQAGFDRPERLVQLGLAHEMLRRNADATTAFSRALAMDPDCAPAHLGLARCLLRSRAYEKAAEEALQAIALEFSMAEGHYCLGRALEHLGRTERAIQAYETCVRFDPGHLRARRALSLLYAQVPGAEAQEKAKLHDRLREDWARRRTEARDRLIKIRREAAARAARRQALREEHSQRLMEAISSPDLIPPPAMQEVQVRRGKPGSSGKEFLIVSGLPRSGTSLMMQMLAAGGVPLMTDGQRVADEDNPEGYYEWTPIKQLRRKPHLIEQTEGKAVKVISLLLASLPRVHRYQVIFMRRPPEEVAASQARMLERSGKPVAKSRLPQMVQMLRRHQDAVIARLLKAPNFRTLIVDYPALVANPVDTVARLREFLGPDVLRTPEAMASVVKPSLYRQRAAKMEAGAI